MYLVTKARHSVEMLVLLSLIAFGLILLTEPEENESQFGNSEILAMGR